MMAPAPKRSRCLAPLLVAPVLVALLLGAVSPLPPSAAQEYTIGARDVLKVTVWGQDDLTRDYPVDQDGFVPTQA